MKRALAYLDALSKPRAAVPSYVVCSGAEEYLRAQVRRQVINKLGSDTDVIDLEWTKEESDRRPLGEVLDDLCTGSLFGGAKVLVIREAGRFIADHGKAFEAFVREWTELPTGTLILEGETLVKPRAKKLSGPLKAVVEVGGEVVDCGPLKSKSWDYGSPAWDHELSRWIVVEAKARGRTMTFEVAHGLHLVSTGGMRGIASELDKLVLHVGDREEIIAADIEEVCHRAENTTLYEVVECFARRDDAGAVRAAESLFAHGFRERGRHVQDASEIAIRLSILIGTRLRELGRLMELVRGGLRFDDAAGQVVGVGRKFLFPKLRQQLEVRSARDLGNAVLRLAQLEHDLKSGVGAPRNLFMRFLCDRDGVSTVGGDAS